MGSSERGVRGDDQGNGGADRSHPKEEVKYTIPLGEENERPEVYNGDRGPRFKKKAGGRGNQGRSCGANGTGSRSPWRRLGGE